MVQEFSHQTRKKWINELRSAASRNKPHFDAILIGGGIVGAGLARELRSRNLSVLLVEKGDFASGTSSKSSKLIHGGLRYLEMFDFRLVFEALAERHWLLQSHPHLVQPLEFNLPNYDLKDAPAGARGSALLGAGLWVYDALSLFRTPFFHGRHSADEMQRLFPHLRSRGLLGGYYYADATMLDDEIVLEVLKDAVDHGATCLNYVKAKGVRRSDQSTYSVELGDTLNAEDQSFTVTASQVIVCVGPWTEEFGMQVQGGAGKKLKPSKGVHLVVPWAKLPVERCLVMYAADGRIVFAIPRRDFGPGAEVVIIGTTDSPVREKIDSIYTEKSDVEYLLRVVSEYFPEHGIQPEDVLTTFAGVRPLLESGAIDEARTSREHEIWRNTEGVVFMAGGKYTTFRKISMELADAAFPGTSPDSKQSRAPLSLPSDYAARFSGRPLWGKFTEGWIRWKIKYHAACTLEDVVFRRLPLWMAGTAVNRATLQEVADVCSSEWGWTELDRAAQIERVWQKLQGRGMTLSK